MPARIHKNGTKNRQFPSLIDLKITENSIFHTKDSIIYTPKMFFEEYIHFKNFRYLGIVELYLFKVLGVRYAHSPSD
jgi:hypothetical protein